MQYLMLACVVLNVAQAIVYRRLEGKPQPVFWALATICGGCYAISYAIS